MLNNTPPPSLEVDIWSDIVCPFCFIGRQNFQLALAQFAQVHPDVQVNTRWRSFELDPQAPALDPRSMLEILSQKYGRSPSETQAMIDNMQSMATDADLEIRLQGVHRINTFDLHRLLHFAHAHHRQDALKAAFMHGYFTDNLNLSQTEVIMTVVKSVGLPTVEARAILASDQYHDAVRSDQKMAREQSIQGVPFFVFNQALGVSGAQPVKILFQALKQSTNLS